MARLLSWSLGSCNSNGGPNKYLEYENNKEYNQTCCFLTSPTLWVYELNCNQEVSGIQGGSGWKDGFITINGRKYCHDFDSGYAKTVYVEANPCKHIPYIFCLLVLFVLCKINFNFDLKIITICISAPGGWSEGEFSKCHGTCGDAKMSKYKYCDSPEPSHRWVQGIRQRTGEKCLCNSADSTEVFCDGLAATSDKPCNDVYCK